ncbi:glycosyltransferase [Zobellia laminariae]|uniref:glycosyltransferase n=1 Tax=Zobellia laminariae TaxID=248906 RepID=UPI001396B67B
MKHMCNLLKAYYPDEYETIIFPDIYKNLSTISFVRRIQIRLIKEIVIPYKYLKIGKELSNQLNDGDSIYLLEYCGSLFPQLSIAKYLRNLPLNIKIYGLVHLVPQKIEESFTQNQLVNCLKPLDYVMTLGSSLSNFFVQKVGVQSSKVKTVFHYVDLEYYKPLVNYLEKKDSPPSVLVMGNQKRNFTLLYKIVEDNPEIQFTICQGVMDLSDQFKNCNNVQLVGFVEEEELLGIMQRSDISLNIMEDTIGSNVITTSMAVGMAIVVSNVGSIKDYCKEDGAIYCENEDASSFSQALKQLMTDQNKLQFLKRKSIKYSKNLTIANLHKSF